MLEVPLNNIGQRLDVLVRVHRPIRTGHDPVIVEHPQRPDAHLIRIAVMVEREVPAGMEPPTVRLEDLAVTPDGQHYPALLRLIDPATLRLADGASHPRSEEHTSELQSRVDLVYRLL